MGLFTVFFNKDAGKIIPRNGLNKVLAKVSFNSNKCDFIIE